MHARTPEELSRIVAVASIQLREASAEQIVGWAGETFGDRLAVASSMADTVVVALAANTAPGVDVLFLDTGYHFPETIGTRDAVAATYPVNVVTLRPEYTVAQQDELYGPDLFARDPNRCCAMRKVAPLARALADYDAWITGMRREDSPTRENIGVVEFDERRGKVKVNPIAGWTADDVAAYLVAHQVLVNPLIADGYPSVGCRPCTTRVSPGADPRSGRWAGTVKTECGLHG